MAANLSSLQHSLPPVDALSVHKFCLILSLSKPSVITERCYSSAVLAMGLCLSVCLSVCSSVRPSQVGVLLKRLIIQTTPHDSPGNSSFLTPKISAKFDWGHPLQGRQMQVGWVKIGDFRQITGYISKTVQDRRVVSIKVE